MPCWNAYWRLMRFDRPIGIYLLMWPTLWALWIAAAGHPDWKIVVVFVVGVILTRALGCVMNDWCDYDIDGHVQRTRDRPLPAGELTRRQALGCLLILILLAGTLAVVFLHTSTILFALVGLALALLYPLAKRYWRYPQAVLGFAFAWGIPMAFWQLRQQLPSVAWAMFALTWVWIFVYDTQYALSDIEDDKKLGCIHSSAMSLGKQAQMVLRLGQAVLVLGWLGLSAYLQLWYVCFLAVPAMICLFFYQDRCVTRGTRASCFAAFRSHQWIGLFIFVSVLLN